MTHVVLVVRLGHVEFLQWTELRHDGLVVHIRFFQLSNRTLRRLRLRWLRIVLHPDIAELTMIHANTTRAFVFIETCLRHNPRRDASLNTDGIHLLFLRRFRFILRAFMVRLSVLPALGVPSNDGLLRFSFVDGCMLGNIGSVPDLASSLAK